jgi:hypothetical protein
MQSSGRTTDITPDRRPLVREPPFDDRPYIREPPVEAIWNHYAEDVRRRLALRTADLVRHVCLVEEHRDLDEMITFLSAGPSPDEGLITRLKKRRLSVKDEIARIEKPG